MSSLLPRPNQRRAKAKRLSREGQEGRGGSGSTRGRGPWMSPPCPGVLTGIFPSGTSEGNPVPEEGVCVPAPWQKAALAAPAVYPQCAEVRGSLAAGAAGSDPAAAGERCVFAWPLCVPPATLGGEVWDRMTVLREKMTCLRPRGEEPDLQAMAVIIDQGEKKGPVGGGEPSGSGGEGVMI